MTDYFVFPHLADGLVDGGLAADVATQELRALVDVLQAARQPGSVAELATVATHVQRFAAQVHAAQAPVTSLMTTTLMPTTQLTPSATTRVLDDSLRSNPMFSTRITRKALSIMAITLLAAGTAAAAAGGTLPMFDDDTSEVAVEHTETADQFSVEDNQTGAADSDDSDTTEPSEDAESQQPVVITEETVVRNNSNGDVDHHGKCTAWTNGATKSAENPAFAELRVAADAAEQTIYEYCTTLLGTTQSGDKDKDKDKDKDEADDDEADDDEADDDEADESDDDEADESDDDEADDNAGRGKSGRGHGNGGNGNSGRGNGDD